MGELIRFKWRGFVLMGSVIDWFDNGSCRVDSVIGVVYVDADRILGVAHNDTTKA